MAFFDNPYDSLFAYKGLITGILVALSLAGFALDRLARRARDPYETFTNLSVFMANNALNLFFAQALQIVCLTWLTRFAPQVLPMNAFTFAACLLAVDFCYYWRHRWEHEINLLWAEHSVHHSSEEFNFSTSVRLPVITPFINWIFFAPLALIGFPAKLIVACYFVDLLYQYWVHSGTIGKLGWFDQIFSSPSNHRVHHARNPEYLDKNYGGILIIWDRLFGTHAPEAAKPVYGLVTPIATQNPITLNVRPFLRLFAKARAEKDVAGRLRAVFGRP